MELSKRCILVTGACGFIGSHLVERLVSQNLRVKAFVYYNSFNSWGWLDTLPKSLLKKIEVFTGDIRDPNGVRKAVKDVDLVFHLAALIAIPFSYHSPDSYVDTNIKGLINILQASGQQELERIVVTSTSEVYGTARYVPIDEKHPLQPQSPYSATKIAADAIAESFHRSFGLPVTIARPFNTYGARQSLRAVIPTIITQLLNGAKIIKLGSLYPTRDFNYVTDICNGLIELARCDEAIGKAVNIGSGEEISIMNLAELIMKIIDKKAKIISEKERKRPDKSEVQRLMCDNTLMRQLTGWKPNFSLQQGLAETIKWFKENNNLSAYKNKYELYNI